MKTIYNESNNSTLRYKDDEAFEKELPIIAANLSEDDKIKLIYDLQVRQNELERQNKELILANNLAETVKGKYAELYFNAPLGYFTILRTSEITELNLFGAELFHKELSELVGSRFDSFIQKDSILKFNIFLEKVYSDNGVENCEITLQDVNNPPVYLHLSGTISGSPEKCMLTAVDMTIRKQAELENEKIKNKLEIANAEFAAIYDSSPVIMCILNSKREIIDGNRLFKKVTNWPNGNVSFSKKACGILGCIHSLEHPDGCGFGFNCHECKINIALQNTLKNGANYFDEEYKTTLLVDGKMKDVVLLASTARIPSVDGFRTLLILNDVTEQKKAEKALKESEIRLNKTQKIANLGSWELDVDSGELFWSDEVYNIFGIAPQEFAPSYETFLDRVHPDDRDAVNEAYFNSFKENKDSYEIEHQIIMKNTGEIRHLHEKCEHIRDETRRVVRSIGMVQDITQHKRAEETLRLNEEKFRNIFENSVVGITMTTMDGKLKTNFSYRQILGYSEAELNNLKWNEITHIDDIERDQQIFDSIVSGVAKTARWEKRYIHKNGGIVWVDISTALQRDEKGKPHYFITSINDITERKNTENELIRSRNEFQGYFDMGSMGMCITSPHKGWVEVNDRLVEMLGYTKNELSELTWANLTHPADLNLDVMLFNQVLAGTRDKYEIDKRFIRKNGSVVYTTLCVSCQRNTDGSVNKFLASLIDITKRKLAEEVTKESEARYRSLFDKASEGILILTKEGKIAEVNNAFAEMHGYSLNELKCMDIKELDVFGDKTFENGSEITNRLQNGEVVRFEVEHYHKDGHVFPLSISTSLINISGNEFYQAFHQDITIRKQVEQEIKLKNEQLINLHLEKDKLFSIIAHDFRSPFQAFLGLTDIMVCDADKLTLNQLRSFGKSMNNSARNLFDLLQNLLEWAQMQKGAMDFQQKEMSLAEIIAKNVEILKERSVQKGILINNLVCEPVKIYSDEKMINSVILNLISNAIKFTDRGGLITIKATRIANQMIEVQVSDTGIGMTEIEASKLFILGERTGQKGTEGELSTGLGLLLCKEFVEKNGGQIRVESKQGVGSTFYFTIKSLM